ncbi:MAG TPA: tetratricopeptide repeat protein [Planctomycetota bacterium]|nr:tetratricopeptide repeat protein [Planctomycetota bacterium]
MPRTINTRLILKTIVITWIIVILAFIGGRLVSGVTAGNLLPKARELAAADHFDDAIRMYEGWLAEHPDDEPVLAEYAGVLAKAHRMQFAAEAWQKVLAVNPRNREALLWLVDFQARNAAIAEAMGRDASDGWLKVRDLAAWLVEAHPDSPEGFRQLARAHNELRELDQAVKTLASLVDKHPAEAAAYFDLAELARTRGDQDWRRWVDLCLKNNPASPAAYLLACNYLSFLGDAAARNYLDRALELDASDPDVLAAAAAAEEQQASTAEKKLDRENAQKHFASAAGFLQKLKSTAPADYRSYAGLAQLALAFRGPEPALAELRAGLDACDKPGQLELRYRIADILIAVQRCDEARAELAELRVLDPISPRPAILDGQCLLQENRPHEAIQSARTVLDRVAGARMLQPAARPPWLFQAHLLLGNCYLALGDAGLARSEFSTALEMRPESVDARVALSRALLRSAQPELAVREARRAVDADPLHPDAWLALAAAAATPSAGGTAGNLDAAIPAAGNAARIRPNAESLLLLARLYHAANRESDAESLLKHQPERGVSDVDALKLQFEFFVTTGRLDRAKQAYAGLAKQNAATTRIRLAAARLCSDSPEAAERELLAILASAPQNDKPAVRKALADFYLDHAKTDAAAGQLQAIAAAEPEDPTVRRAMLRLAISKGDRDRANQLLDELVRLEGPDNDQVACDGAELDLLDGDRSAAVRVSQALKPVCEKTPSSRSWALLGAASTAQGDLNEAIRCYREALRANPGNATAGAGLIAALNEAGRPHEAAEAIDALLHAAPQSSILLGLQLERLMREDRQEDAVALLTRKLEAQPDDLPARLTLGGLLLRTGKPAEAEQHVREAVRLKPDSVGAVAALALLLKQTGRPDEGLTACNNLVQRDPKSPRALLCRAQYLQSTGKANEAAAGLHAAIALQPKDGDLLVRLGDLAGQLGDRRQAFTLYRQAARIDPAARLLLAEKLLASGDPTLHAEAAAIAANILRENPNQAAAYVLKARIALARYDGLKEAEQHCRRAIELAPGAAAAHTLVSLIYQAMGDLDRAAKSASEALTLEPASQQAILRYAELLVLLGRYPEADIVLERAGRSPATVLALARVKVVREGPKAAAEFLRTASGWFKDPPPELALLRAQYLAQSGDDSAAESELQAAVKSGRQYGAVAALVRFLEQRTRTADTDRLFHELLNDGGKNEPQFALLRAEVLIGRGGSDNQAEAERLARDAMARQADASTAERILGDACYARGDSSAAIEHYRAALTADPANAFAANNLAWLLGETGRAGEAVEFARSAVTANRAEASFLDTLGEIAFQQGLYQESQQALARCVEQAPGRTVSWYRLGRTLLKLERPRDACTALQRALQSAASAASSAAGLSEKQRDDIQRWLKEFDTTEKSS